jgi:hypothetical protein
MRRRGKKLRDKQSADHRKIEQNRSGRGRFEPVHRVQHVGKLRHDGDAKEVWKGDARQRDGERMLLRIVAEARRNRAHDRRHCGQRDQQQRYLRRELPGEDVIGEMPAFLGGPAILVDHAGEARHESRVECTFGEDGAKMVRQAESDEEGVGQRAGAENRGHENIARETRDARQQRESADRKQPA